nr:DUF4363 family protein [uncultured Agathobaculum sp.]
MQRIIFSLILCAALALGSVWSENAVDSAIGAIVTDIERGQFAQAHARWEDSQTLLGSLLLHTEVDQADRLFDRVLTAAANGRTDDLRLDCAELLAQLHHLPELQRPTLRNLL